MDITYSENFRVRGVRRVRRLLLEPWFLITDERELPFLPERKLSVNYPFFLSVSSVRSAGSGTSLVKLPSVVLLTSTLKSSVGSLGLRWVF